MTSYNLVAETPKSTVVAEYESKVKHAGVYQTEAELEKEFIETLVSIGYEYLPIHTEKDLIQNLRRQLGILNNYEFTDSEWEDFFKTKIANANDGGIAAKTQKIQEDYIQNLVREDGTTKNILLLDKKTIHNNRLQVINQYTEDQGNHKTRYDVTILVNGLPLVHVELKRRGVPLKEAFNQINRYQRDSFWAGSGLYEYIQIFVISNGTHTKYYSNTTRDNHVQNTRQAAKHTAKKTFKSFEFTSFWADANNTVIPDLIDFAYTFFSKHTLLNIITKYCIFTTDKSLLVMRPYQIVATEKILNCITISTNYKKTGTINAGGYIWHTTGSGKTLTSFKTAQLATELEGIDKVLFVVDRKDLDYQTVKEYDRFQKGAADGNKSTKVLTRQLENRDEKGGYKDYKIIVTTIQKLDNFISKNPKHEIYNKHVVLIFDECHRSQFGDMHTNITDHFKNYHIFGFTGTPIFAQNSVKGKNPEIRTTEQAFGRKLHTYTIVDAINDRNVLPFKIDYVKTIEQKEESKDKQVQAINTKEALEAQPRIENVVRYLLEHFNQKTKRNPLAQIEEQRNHGFNSIFAVSSIPMCMRYYLELKKQISEHPTLHDLRIAIIFSYTANEDDPAEDATFSVKELDKTSRDFLDMAIDDYNAYFQTNFDTESEFQNYYKDVSQKVKDKK